MRNKENRFKRELEQLDRAIGSGDNREITRAKQRIAGLRLALVRTSLQNKELRRALKQMSLRLKHLNKRSQVLSGVCAIIAATPVAKEFSRFEDIPKSALQLLRDLDDPE